MDFSSIVESTGKSIVRVEGRRTRPSSGVVWGPNRVVTAAHAIDRDGDIVIGVEGAEYKAKLKGRDTGTDLALLEVEGTLPVAQLDDGAGVKVGQPVVLLARPGETVRATGGIIQSRGNKPWRTPRGGEIDRYLESDAAHQPGWSGGALASASGSVLGITSSGLVRGSSLTVPVPTVKRVVAQLEQHGQIRRSWVGLSLQPVRLPDDVQKTTGEEIGLLVVGVEKGGPGEKAGIAYGDTVLHLGDDTVKSLEDFYAWMRQDRVGQTFPAKVFRNGKVDTVQVTLGAKA